MLKPLGGGGSCRYESRPKRKRERVLHKEILSETEKSFHILHFFTKLMRAGSIHSYTHIYSHVKRFRLMACAGIRTGIPFDVRCRLTFSRPKSRPSLPLLNEPINWRVSPAVTYVQAD